MDRVRALVHLNKNINASRIRDDNVNIAILDTGIVGHPDLVSNIKGFIDCVGGYKRMYDDNGHGTHVAGIASGTGKVSNKTYQGIAPELGIYSIKVLDYNGDGKQSI